MITFVVTMLAVVAAYAIWFAVEMWRDAQRYRSECEALRAILDQVETRNLILQGQLDSRTAERLGW